MKCQKFLFAKSGLILQKLSFTEHYIDLTSWTLTTHNTLFAISLFSMMIRVLKCLEEVVLIVMKICYL